jgi:putative ABC transport system substrate-binding protein
MTLRRRDFITLLGGAAAWPVAARAQQAASGIIGWLDAIGERDSSAFRLGLQDAGYTASGTVPILYFASPNDLIPHLAVIVATGELALTAAKAATPTIPIVFYSESDPIKLSLVSRLDRPGGNLTGVISLGNPMVEKQLQLLHNLVRDFDTVAYLTNPTNPNAESTTLELQTAASLLGLRVQVLNASSAAAITMAFATLVQDPAGGLLVARDSLFARNLQLIARLALNQRMPTIASFHEFVTWSGLMTYGPSKSAWGRQVGAYVGRILKGEDPGNLPVVQFAKFDFAINVTTAAALGLEVPRATLSTADAVIE